MGFSATIRKINSRICLEILPPPPTRFCTLQSMVQYRLNPAWCHRATLSGRTRKSDFIPIGPEVAHYDPEQFVKCPQSWPRVLAFQHSQLLAEREIF